MKGKFKLLIIGYGIFILMSCGKSVVKPKIQPPIKGVEINGTAYLTDTIGSQVWLAVNYSGTGGYHITYSNYNYDGYFYTQSQALALTLPTGWRVPSIADFNKMLSNFGNASNIDAYGDYALVNPEMLITTQHWIDVQHQGTNAAGLNIVQTPYVTIQNGQISSQDGQFSYFVTSDSKSTSGILQYSFQFDPDFEFIGINQDPATHAFNLRLVKDL